MAASCKCKKKKVEECEECPEWIFTFADLVMLMMGFFVILWVLKPAPGKKGDGESESSYLIKVAAAIREGFTREGIGYVPNPSSKDPVDVQMEIDGLSRVKINGPGEASKSESNPNGPVGPEPDVTTIRPGRQVTEGGRMLFDRGTATLSDDTKHALDQVAEVIRGHQNIVLVKGHTSLDDLADNATPQEMMDLSLKRAEAAADYLESRGVSAEILRVQGCSTYEPLEQGDYAPDAQSLNRRVEVEATSMLVNDVQGSHPKATTQGQPGTATQP